MKTVLVSNMEASDIASILLEERRSTIFGEESVFEIDPSYMKCLIEIPSVELTIEIGIEEVEEEGESLRKITFNRVKGDPLSYREVFNMARTELMDILAY